MTRSRRRNDDELLAMAFGVAPFLGEPVTARYDDDDDDGNDGSDDRDEDDEGSDEADADEADDLDEDELEF